MIIMFSCQGDFVIQSVDIEVFSLSVVLVKQL